MEPLTASTIPMTAWEQAGIVVLFVLFVLALLMWFSRQQQTWQEFIQVENVKWQEFLKEQRERDNGPILQVISVVDKLADKVTSLEKSTVAHHAAVQENLIQINQAADRMSKAAEGCEARSAALDHKTQPRSSDPPG